MRKNILYCHHSFSLENIKGASNYKIIKSGRSLDLAFQLGAMTIIGLFSFNAYAECTPTPDCESIGYTETSCEGASLKCPFDISKLYCIPCDSSFRYDCSGDNITGGEGDTCGGKYVSCECNAGSVFKNGECTCPSSVAETDCLVGTIYYPNGKCSNDYVACLNPVGLVVKNNSLVMSPIVSREWGTDGIDVDTLTNEGNYPTNNYTGKNNTALLVEFQTTEGLTSENSAAIYCNEYAPTGMESSKGQWYLPAAGELYSYVYNNYSTLNPVATIMGWDRYFDRNEFWSSTEKSSGYAWWVRIGEYTVSASYKSYSNYVSCFLNIN